MKEYICKDDLRGLNQYAYGIEEIITDIPTVTKADICREILYEVLVSIDRTRPKDATEDSIKEMEILKQYLRIIFQAYIESGCKTYDEYIAKMEGE